MRGASVRGARSRSSSMVAPTEIPQLTPRRPSAAASVKHLDSSSSSSRSSSMSSSRSLSEEPPAAPTDRTSSFEDPGAPRGPPPYASGKAPPRELPIKAAATTAAAASGGDALRSPRPSPEKTSESWRQLAPGGPPPPGLPGAPLQGGGPPSGPPLNIVVSPDTGPARDPLYPPTAVSEGREAWRTSGGEGGGAPFPRGRGLSPFGASTRSPRASIGLPAVPQSPRGSVLLTRGGSGGGKAGEGGAGLPSIGGPPTADGGKCEAPQAVQASRPPPAPSEKPPSQGALLGAPPGGMHLSPTSLQQYQPQQLSKPFKLAAAAATAAADTPGWGYCENQQQQQHSGYEGPWRGPSMPLPWGAPTRPLPMRGGPLPEASPLAYSLDPAPSLSYTRLCDGPDKASSQRGPFWKGPLHAASSGKAKSVEEALEGLGALLLLEPPGIGIVSAERGPLTAGGPYHYEGAGGLGPLGPEPLGAPPMGPEEVAMGAPLGGPPVQDLHAQGALLVQQVGRAHGFEGPRRRGEGPLLSEGAAKLIYSAVEGRLLQTECAGRQLPCVECCRCEGGHAHPQLQGLLAAAAVAAAAAAAVGPVRPPVSRLEAHVVRWGFNLPANRLPCLFNSSSNSSGNSSGNSNSSSNSSSSSSRVVCVCVHAQPVLGYDGVTCCRYIALPRPLTGSRLLRRQKARPQDALLQLQQQQQRLQQLQQQQQPQQDDEAIQHIVACGPALPAYRPQAIPSSSSSSSSSNVNWEECVDLEALVCSDLLLPPPRRPCLGVHWLAVEGEAPALPQNEPPPWAALAVAAVDTPAAAAAAAATAEEGASLAALRMQQQSRMGQAAATAAPGLKALPGAAAAEAAAAAAARSGFALKLYTKQQQQQQQQEEEEDAGGDLLPVEELLIAPKVACALGKEQQLFLASVTEALEAAMEERAGLDSARTFSRTLQVLRQISALEPLLPSLAQLFASKLPAYQHLPHRAVLLLQLGEALLQNPNTTVHAHVHQFALPLLDCLLAPLTAPPLAASLSSASSSSSSAAAAAAAAEAEDCTPGLFLALTPQQLRLRRKAASVLGCLCSRARIRREALETVEEAVALQLLRALLHPASGLDSACGAAMGLRALGRKAVLLLLLPHAPLLLHALERGRDLVETQRLAVTSSCCCCCCC
ncbi:hypothetical protein Emag_007372 [Eimeria magna]